MQRTQPAGPLLAGQPADVRHRVAAALTGVGGRPTAGWTEGHRLYVLADGPDGPLFVQAGRGAADAQRLADEVALRLVVATHCPVGPLRAPGVMAHQDGVLVSRLVTRARTPGPGDAAVLARAVGQVAALPLPTATRRSPDPLPARLRVRLMSVRGRALDASRLVRSPVPWADVRRARAVLSAAGSASDGSPLVTVHGDLHAGNVLVIGSGPETQVVVLDWELARSGPAGLDAAQLAVTLTPAAGDALWAVVVAGLDPTSSRRLAGLRYALAVRVAVMRWAEGDVAGSAALRRRLPALRTAAGL